MTRSLLFSFCVLSAAVFVLLALANKAESRYQVYACQYGVIHAAPSAKRTQVDYLVLSNSRGLVAIDAPRFAADFSNVSGEAAPVVWHFGKSWRGPEIMHRLGRDTVAAHDVKHVLLEFNLSKSPVYRYHEYSPFFLTSADLVRLMWLEDRDTLWRRGSRLLRMHADRVTRMVEDALLQRRKDLPAKASEYDPSSSIDCNTSGDEVNTKALADRRSHPDSPTWNQRWLQWDLNAENERLSTDYYKRIISELQAEGIDVTLFHVPEYFEPELAPDFASQIQTDLGVPLLHMSRAERTQLYQRGMFHDSTHFTKTGSAFYHAWLISALRSASTSIEGSI